MMSMSGSFIGALDDHVANHYGTHSTFLKITFSKLTLIFILLIGLLTVGCVWLYSEQYSESRPVCLFNDLLPPESYYYSLSMPIVIFCRSVEFSLIINYVQLILSILALYASIKGRKIFFILCYNFIFVTFSFGCLFFLFIWIIFINDLVIKATIPLFITMLTHDSDFCTIVEPHLICTHRFFLNSTFDIIEERCGARSIKIPDTCTNCIEYLTEFTLMEKWIYQLTAKYSIFSLIIFIQVSRFYWNKKRMKLPPVRRPQTSLDSRNDSVTVYLNNLRVPSIDLDAISNIEETSLSEPQFHKLI